MAIGYLQIQIRTAHGAVPISGAAVKIQDDRGRLVYQLTTDENGETPMVSLETVDKSLSLDSGYSGDPYVNYEVFAGVRGFKPVHISGVSIFDGEKAVLPVALVPEGKESGGTGEDGRQGVTEITIGKPAVAMEGQRRQEGPVTSAYVLRYVVIPNPITVHLGSPTASAANVQVSFPDYVKNAASSEIYPTWPEEALRANIYAIITFALNRVFTEWYRSRGYSFDITNSTAYDQAFVYGRTIYESISRIVDEIFNEYVRIRGQNAPYFTSFCNGTTATCQGLSQWGTVTLAQQGLSPLQILRSYYPPNIEIAQTGIITGILSSYPGTPLGTGSTGLNVQTIQTWLGRIRKNYPAIPVINDETGVFGGSTKAAVTRFQEIFNLAPDGVVGKSTWYKMSSIYTAVTRLAELDSEGTSLGIGTVPPNVVLRQGDRGNDVLTLQYLLDMLSEFYAGVPAVSQDGIFGNGTRQGVIAFQQLMGLSPDGIVGPATWNALYDAYLGILENVPLPKPEEGITVYTVQSGDTLWLLSRRFNTTVDAIKRLNGLTSDMLSIGQVLKIPSEGVSSYFEYVVRSGDTLWLLARRFNTTVDAIKQMSGITSDALSIGQVLRIPT
ncbi:MAG: LysM peptidoglycan-binding domain-containing protein [Lachnospiraceae bacterium]|nr:LysM peptidoglycan-binding domain-containing protein [Lachnospiraceae bacterium]